MENFLTELGDLDSFSKRQKKVAEYICENFDTAAFMTAERLAEAADVSESTVIRFASELGFESFSGLRHALQSVLRRRIVDRELDRETAEASVLQKTLARIRQSFSETVNAEFESAFDELCCKVLAAGNVYITGRGKTYALAMYAASSLQELRTGVMPLHTADAAWAVRRLGQDDLLIDLRVDEGEEEFYSSVRERGARVEQLIIGEFSAGVHTNETRLRLGGASAAVMLIDALCSRLVEITNSGEKNDT